MRGFSILSVVVLFAHASPSAAEGADAGCEDDAGIVEAEPAPEPEPEPATTSSAPVPGFARFTIGAYAALGMAHSFYSRSEDPSPRFAGGGGAYVDLRLARAFALDVGIDLIGKGSMLGGYVGYRFQILYLEIPLGVKFIREGLALGIALGIDVGLFNKKTPLDKGGIYEVETNNWDAYKRFNLSPRATLGYAIPVGPIAIVPGVAWSIEALSALPKNEYHDWTLHNMNLMITLGAELGLVPSKASAAAPAPAPPRAKEPFNRFALGVHGSLGASWPTMRNIQDTELAPMYERVHPRLEGGGGVDFDLYLSAPFALDIGIGLIGKGHKFSSTDQRGFLYLRIPVGVKLSFYGVRVGLALALDVALRGESKYYDNDIESNDSTVWDEDQWRSYRRFNLGPLLSLGYAIQVKKIAIVPGVSWSMDLLDNAISRDDGDFELRNMNVMFNLGLERGFGG
jgi:hypothetical protein